MNQPQRMVVVAAAVVTLVTGAAWWLLPSMQSSRRRVESETAVHVERARRLLDRFNADLAYRGLLVGQLREAEVDVDAGDPGALAEKAGDAYQAAHEELWKSFEPKEWSSGRGSPARANYGNIPGQIREGVGARAKLLAENAKLLDEALAESEAALGVSVGETSGRIVSEAHRIKATVLYHQGMAQRVAASLKRSESEPILRELAGYARMAEALRGAGDAELLAESERHIEEVRGRLTEAEGRVAEWRAEAIRLDGEIHEMEQKLTSATARLNAARTNIERLRTRGVDFSDPAGGETFARQLHEQDSIFRSAQREAQEIEAGAMPKATIDSTGDFLRGRYLENGSSEGLTTTHGLNRLRDERAVLTMKIESEEKGIASLREDLARMEAMKESIARRQSEAAARSAAIAVEAGKAFDELNRLQSEAEAIEERALQSLEKSASAAQQSVAALDEWMSNSRERVEKASPAARERSAFQSRTDDAWLSGFSGAGVADARAARAWVFYDRYDAAKRTAEALESVLRAMPLAEADVESMRTKAEAARAAGIAEIETAMNALERAHRNAERHWTLSAQGAELTYMMVLFGRKDYLADAVEAYRSALKGRENETFAARLVTRLRDLESR